MSTSCAGQHELFESTTKTDHLRAATICAACPALDWCRDELQKARRDAYSSAYGPQGTWAGQLVAGRPTKAQLAGEEAAWSPAEMSRAHRRYRDGDRDPHTVIGERIYQRTKKRAQRRAAA